MIRFQSIASITLFLRLVLLLFHFNRYQATSEYDLFPLPVDLPEVVVDQQYGKFIPRNLWIAVKDRKDEIPGHLKDFFGRNLKWKVNVCDNYCKDQFMNTTYHGTSVLWAYNMINPLVGAAKADIWRYAVLYAYGGVYLDDDSDMKWPLDEIISPTDRLLMSEEGSSSMGECYNPNYHLSDTYALNQFSNHSAAAHFHGMGKEAPIFFHDHTLINWAIFTAPRHPLFARTLTNVVEIVRSEYLRRSVLHMTRWDKRWKYVMCTTGFTLTYTLREMLLQNALPAEFIPAISVNNFKQYGGNVKAFWTGADTSHYRKVMDKHSLNLLKQYAVVHISAIIEHLEGRTVMGDAGKQVFLIHNGTRRGFGDYDTFLGLGFADKQTKHVADNVLEAIPVGNTLSLDEADTIKAYVKKRLAMPAVFAHHHERKSHQHQKHLGVGEQHSAPAPAATPAAPSETRSLLSQAMAVLNNQTVTCFGDDYAGTRDDFLNDVYRKQLGDTPTMVYPFCARTFQLGNTLGYFLNDLACADLSGAHFIAVHKEFKLLDPDSLVTRGAAQLAFFDALPDLVVNPAAKSPADVKSAMRAECTCLQFCWEHSKAPWLKRLDLVRKVVLSAIEAYVSAAGGYSIGTVLNNQTDKSSLPTLDAPLPLLPNVTIQYRCGDNIGFGKTRYGLLPFSAFNTRRIDPAVAQYIYVIADSPTRSVGHAYSGRCDTILQKLFEHLRQQFPAAVVVVKRGGDAFLDYARLAHSQVVVCSASTFCFWPAVANTKGSVHFPLTPLIANAGSNETAPHLGDSFHWIREVEMLKDFKKYRPWTGVIDDLQTL